MRRRRRKIVTPKNIWSRIERSVIRTVVLGAVCLVLAQMALGLAKDPVEFYMSVAQEVESPAMDFTPVSGTLIEDLTGEQAPNNIYTVKLKAVPAAPVRVLQNGQLLGTLTKGQLEIPVQAGLLQFDATNCPQIVRIQVVNKDSQLKEPKLNQTLTLEHSIQMLRVMP